MLTFFLLLYMCSVRRSCAKNIKKILLVLCAKDALSKNVYDHLDLMGPNYSFGVLCVHMLNAIDLG